MERICVYCKKTVQNVEDMQFCPYCGTSMTQTNTSTAHNNVAWKIETTWGNQANYADKVKRIGGELISRIRTWIMEQETFIEGRNPAEFVTAQQLRDDFAFLRASSDTGISISSACIKKGVSRRKIAENQSRCLCRYGHANSGESAPFRSDGRNIRVC